MFPWHDSWDPRTQEGSSVNISSSVGIRALHGPDETIKVTATRMCQEEAGFLIYNEEDTLQEVYNKCLQHCGWQLTMFRMLPEGKCRK